MIFAGIAQLVEQLICNHQVPSSTLGAGTISQYIILISKKPVMQPDFTWIKFLKYFDLAKMSTSNFSAFGTRIAYKYIN